MMSNVIQLATKPSAPVYPIGATFTMLRKPTSSAWDTVAVKVETARWTECGGWLHTVAIDTGKKYPHWRVMFQGQIERQAIKPAALVA